MSNMPGPTTSNPQVIGRSRGRRLPAALAAAVLATSLLAGGTTAAHAVGTFFCPDATQPYAPVADVEDFNPGHQVTGLSVTHGTTPEQFTGAYVGFIDDALGKDKDLLLFRLSSPVIDGTESTGGLKGAGIWAGMSGSPVYDGDGRLIGAVAYSLTNENLPIAGVTPAEYMKSIGASAIGASAFGPSARVRATRANLRTTIAGTAAAGTSLAGSTFSQVRTVNVAGTAGTKQNAFANRTLARTPGSAAAASFLRSNTFLPAAAEARAAVTQPLVAGGTIAATYTNGDRLSGAIGTVTAVCGDTVWAFGHPMAYTGKASLLMANASTALIVPDGAGLVGSYKQVSQFGAPVGMVTQDRKVGIRGTLGAVRTFGIDVDVQNAAGTHIADYSVGVADPEVAASAVAGITGQAAYEQLDQFGAGTGEVTWTIDYRREDGSTDSLTNSTVASDATAFPDVISTPPADDVWAITSNEFEEAAITHIRITLRLLSPDALSYKASDVQVRSKGAWKTLSDRRLKAGNTYKLRPKYLVKKNGRSHGNVTGAAVTLKLKSSARKSGWFRFEALNNPDQVCSTDSSGDAKCDDWDAGVTDTYSSFDDLIAALDAAEPDSLVVGESRYRLKKGSTGRDFSWTGPGVVTGSVKVGFGIRK
ncbi:MAG: hypothetical protein ACOH1Y_03400 [Propionicimonas sp.]